MPHLGEIDEYHFAPILTFPRAGGGELFSPRDLEWGRYLKEMAC